MLITLVTVTYNAEETLSATLRSVERQSFRDFEHIIMDGGSKDSTVQIAEQYKKENPDISVTVVSERDGGLYDAMNKALRIARGRFVCFLNAGDELYDKGTLETVAAAAKECPDAGVVYGDTVLIDGDGKVLGNRRLSPPERLTWRSFRMGMLVCHQSFYANRQIAGEYDMSYRFSADFDWCVRIMKEARRKGMPLVNTHAVLTRYLSEGMTTKNHKASLRERFRIMAKHYGLLPTIAFHAWFVVRSAIKR